MAKCCDSSLKQTTLLLIGCGMTIFGTVFAIYWPRLFNHALHRVGSIFQELTLSLNSKSFQMWEVTPIPVYVEFYFFNWTNPEDLKSPGNDGKYEKPNLVELGPYVFREFKKKVVDSWNWSNNTITFRQNKTWIFEPTRSNGSLEDVVQTINIPAISAAFASRNLGGIMKLLLDQSMDLLGTQYFVQKKVGEFLFDGYEDPLLNLALLLPASWVPVSLPQTRFGWFYGRNGSASEDGVFNMGTGGDEIGNVGKLFAWNYGNETSIFDNPCGWVAGSGGEIFPPHRTASEITFFSPDICRSITLPFKEEVHFHGIRGFRFWGDESLFSNEASCWCPSGECPPSGALDVSTCKFGSPAFVSFPHFLHADRSYRDAVTGMSPQEDVHQMFIDLEPRTGIPLEVSAAFQINVLLEPQEGFSLFKDVPKIYFPALWFRQRAELDDALGFQLKVLLALPTIGLLSSIVVLMVGLVILIIAIGSSVYDRKIKDDASPAQRFPSTTYGFLMPLLHSPFKLQNVISLKLRLYK